MQKIAEITFQDNQFFLKGELDFSNVMAIFLKSLPDMNQCEEINLDFSELKSSDSSGLALVIEWVKLAKSLKKPIHFSHFPEKLLSIAKAGSLDSLIVS